MSEFMPDDRYSIGRIISLAKEAGYIKHCVEALLVIPGFEPNQATITGYRQQLEDACLRMGKLLEDNGHE